MKLLEELDNIIDPFDEDWEEEDEESTGVIKKVLNYVLNNPDVIKGERFGTLFSFNYDNKNYNLSHKTIDNNKYIILSASRDDKISTEETIELEELMQQCIEISKTKFIQKFNTDKNSQIKKFNDFFKDI